MSRRTPSPILLDAALVERTSGLDLLRGQADGHLPLPPIHHLTGIRPVEAEEGKVLFAMPASDWPKNELQVVFGGAIGFLAKSAVAGAVQKVAPAGTRYRALDMKTNFLRPVLPDGTDLVATGTVVYAGRQLAIASAEVVHQGKVVALATGTTELYR